MFAQFNRYILQIDEITMTKSVKTPIKLSMNLVVSGFFLLLLLS